MRRTLLPPDSENGEPGPYTLEAASARAEKEWKKLCRNYPQAAQNCYDHLVTNPFRRISARVYPLRGSEFKGLWEFEVTGAQRLYYVPPVRGKVVIVTRAGGHRSPPK